MSLLNKESPWTLEEQVKLARLLKDYFPELGTDDEMCGGDVVESLCELYSSLPQVESRPCNDYAPDTLNPCIDDQDVCTNCYYRKQDHSSEVQS